MTYMSGILEHPDTLVDEEAANELVARIEKLRWIGMLGEVERLEVLRRSVHLADVVLSPCETD